MEGTLGTLLSLVFWGILITLFILGKIKVFTSLSLLMPMGYSFTVGAILLYGLKNILKERMKQGPDIPFLPFAIGLIVFGLVFLCWFIDKLSKRSPDRPTAYRWLWLISGELILITGLVLALMSLYVLPKYYGFDRISLPGLACFFWLTFVTMSCFVWYRASRMNSEAYPNLMRYVVFVVNYFSFTYTLIIALILIYAAPSRIVYVFWGAIITLGFLPPSLLMLGIARDQLPVGLFSASGPTPDLSQGVEG